jgi:tetratricopeptide (TPR) repeat protein
MVEALYLRTDLGELEDGLQILSDAIDRAPANVELRRLRGELYLRRNKADQALADFDEAIKHTDDYALIHFDRGTALDALYRFDEARDSYSRALEAEPNDTAVLMYRAQAAACAGDVEQAIEDTNHLLAIDPDEPIALALRAGALGDLHLFEEALRDIDRAIDLEPESSDFIAIWSLIMERAGTSESAIEELRQKVDDKPDDVVSWLKLGLLYAAQHRMGQASDAYSTLIKLGQYRGFAYYRRADAFRALGKATEALADYNNALKFDPENSGVLNELAWLLATAPEQDLRDGEKAVELASRACELTYYQQAHILSTLAAGYAETGDFDAARTWWQKSLQIADESLKKKLREELDCYEKNEPYRDVHADVEPEPNN